MAASGSWAPWGLRAMEPILYYGSDPRAGKKDSSPNGRDLREPAPDNGHPCPKPLRAWQWLLNKGSLEGS